MSGRPVSAGKEVFGGIEGSLGKGKTSGNLTILLMLKSYRYPQRRSANHHKIRYDRENARGEDSKEGIYRRLLCFLFQFCICLSNAAQILHKKKKTDGMTEFCGCFLEHLLENLRLFRVTVGYVFRIIFCHDNR